MRSYETNGKAYIETERCQCVARFCKVSMEIFAEDGRVLYVRGMTRQLRPSEVDWILFKLRVKEFLDFDLTDDCKPPIFEG